MKKKRSITDQELDALLSAKPLSPSDSFEDRVLIKATPATDLELDALLSGNLQDISSDFTERTLIRIDSLSPEPGVAFPPFRWLLRSGMAAAALLIGLFSYSLWHGSHSSPKPTEVAKADLAAMELEELLYLEETLSSAKVLIELEKTVPLYYFIEEADS